MRLRVLIADPDKLLLAVYRALLAATGVEVITASNGRDCLAALRGAAPDLLVIDNDAPWNSGDEIATLLDDAVANWPVAVLLVTADLEKFTAANTSSPGYRLLIKPVRPATVADVIRTLAEAVGTDRPPRILARPTVGCDGGSPEIRQRAEVPHQQTTSRTGTGRAAVATMARPRRISPNEPASPSPLA